MNERRGHLLSFNLVCAVFCVLLVNANIGVPRSWLDRVVAYHKNRFYNEVLQYAPIELQATIQRAPPGYADSPAWTVDSVMHLLVLISESETATPVKLALRRMLKPTRRIMMMTKQKSFKFFPSLANNHPSNFYYDMDTDEDYNNGENEEFSSLLDDDAVIVVSNPVEARLPSAQISVKLLKDILEARAQAGRVMPSTTTTPIPWTPLNKTQSNDKSTNLDDNAPTTVASPDGGPATGGDAAPAGGDSSPPDAGSSDTSPATTTTNEPAGRF